MSGTDEPKPTVVTDEMVQVAGYAYANHTGKPFKLSDEFAARIRRALEAALKS